jgi:hypothetical protein
VRLVAEPDLLSVRGQRETDADRSDLGESYEGVEVAEYERPAGLDDHKPRRAPRQLI